MATDRMWRTTRRQSYQFRSEIVIIYATVTVVLRDMPARLVEYKRIVFTHRGRWNGWWRQDMSHKWLKRLKCYLSCHPFFFQTFWLCWASLGMHSNFCWPVYIAFCNRIVVKFSAMNKFVHSINLLKKIFTTTICIYWPWHGLTYNRKKLPVYQDISTISSAFMNKGDALFKILNAVKGEKMFPFNPLNSWRKKLFTVNKTNNVQSSNHKVSLTFKTEYHIAPIW